MSQVRREWSTFELCDTCPPASPFNPGIPYELIGP